MQQNPDVGCGKVAFGLRPPFRTGGEWRRIWIHFKANTKKKLANDRVNVLATGGGPSEEIQLSSLEESVISLVDMTRQIQPEERAFGVENVEPSSTASMSVIEEAEITSGSKRMTITPRKRNGKMMDVEQQGLQILKQQEKTPEKILEKMLNLEKTCYKQYLLAKEKFEFKKRRSAAEEELLNLMAFSFLH